MPTMMVIVSSDAAGPPLGVHPGASLPPCDYITPIDGRVPTTSLVVAEHFGKRHACLETWAVSARGRARPLQKRHLCRDQLRHEPNKLDASLWPPSRVRHFLTFSRKPSDLTAIEVASRRAAPDGGDMEAPGRQPLPFRSSGGRGIHIYPFWDSPPD